MKLSQMRIDFNKMTEEEQIIFIRSYRQKRNQDYDSADEYFASLKKRNPAKPKVKLPALSDAEKALLKKLGANKTAISKLLSGE